MDRSADRFREAGRLRHEAPHHPTQQAALAVGGAVDLLTVLATYQAMLARISELLAKAHAEGRSLTPEELQTVIEMDDFRRAKLEATIAAAMADADAAGERKT